MLNYFSVGTIIRSVTDTFVEDSPPQSPRNNTSPQTIPNMYEVNYLSQAQALSHMQNHPDAFGQVIPLHPSLNEQYSDVPQSDEQYSESSQSGLGTQTHRILLVASMSSTQTHHPGLVSTMSSTWTQMLTQGAMKVKGKER